MNAISLSFEGLDQAIQNAVNIAVNRAIAGASTEKTTELPDRIVGTKEAAAVVGCSESYLYQKTMPKNAGSKDAPPFSRFGRKLIFSRSELLAWRDSKTKSENLYSEISAQLAASAKRKIA